MCTSCAVMSMHMHTDLKYGTYHPCPLVQHLHNRIEQSPPAAVQSNMFAQLQQASQVFVQCIKKQDSMFHEFLVHHKN